MGMLKKNMVKCKCVVSLLILSLKSPGKLSKLTQKKLERAEFVIQLVESNAQTMLSCHQLFQVCVLTNYHQQVKGKD